MVLGAGQSHRPSWGLAAVWVTASWYYSSVVGGPTGGAGRPSQAYGVSFADERAASSGDGIRDPGRIVAVEWRGLARRGKRGPPGASRGTGDVCMPAPS